MRARQPVLGVVAPLAALLVAALLPVSTSTAAPATATPASAAISRVPTAAASARTAAVTVYAPRIPTVTRWRVPVRVRQVIVVRATSWSTTHATVSLYSRTTGAWHRVASWPARIGYTGMVVGTRRVQDSGKTPAGVYGITETFGRLGNPGTRMAYTKVTTNHWWVEDRRSAYYNQMRLGTQGGFALRTNGFNASERLGSMGAQYDYAAVINFNRPKPVIGRGAGIFLHAYGSGATAGCVSIRHDHMRAVLRWLNPAAYPRIVIGTVAYLAP